MSGWTRREWLKAALASGTLAGLGSGVQVGASREEPDLVIHLKAAPDTVPLWTGERTQVLRFTAKVASGRQAAVRAIGSYLGPILDLRRGEHVRIVFENGLNEASIVHWHGLLVPEQADGHPRFAVSPGQRYSYEFTVLNPAGTYLYHPHPHGRTGPQVYAGLAGLLIVREPWENAAGLPAGPYELPLVLQDRRVDSTNQFVYKGMRRMDEMSGMLGDTVMVNGKPDAHFKVEPRAYRLRIANISNARVYKLAWSDGEPMTLVGTDNGLLDSVQERPFLVLGPTERVEVVANFARRPGREVALVSRPFSAGGMGEMMHGMMGGGGMMGNGGMMHGMMRGGQGEELHLATFSIARERAVPAQALDLPDHSEALPEPKAELNTELAFRHMRGFLNGRRFEMTSVASDEHLLFGKPVRWTFRNPGGMMAMLHPIHVHSTRFRIIERRGRRPSDLADGIVDDGFKDTVLVFPGEEVSVHLVPTAPGLFLYHCHNLEHEDGGMMRNYHIA